MGVVGDGMGWDGMGWDGMGVRWDGDGMVIRSENILHNMPKTNQNPHEQGKRNKKRNRR